MKKILFALAILAIAASAQANLLVNGNFEAGGSPPAGWTFDRATWAPNFLGQPDTAAGNDGVWNPGSTPEGSWVGRKSVGTNLAGSYWIYQVINTTADTIYSITGLYAGGVGGAQNFNGTAWWEVVVAQGGYDPNNIDGSGPRQLIAKTEIGGPGSGFGWTPVAGQFTATGTQVTVALKYGVWTPDWQWNYFGAYWDAFDVSAIPEPASLLALGSGLVGLAGFAIRRRK